MGLPGLDRHESAKALIVDDDNFSRLIMKRRLASLGIEVEEACDGAQALDTLQRFEFDLIIMDLEMPGVDGLACLGIIRGHPKFKHLPVIVLTSDERRSASEKALAAGATSFLLKPLNWSAFGPHIKHVTQLVSTSRLALENMGHSLALFEADGTVALCNQQYRKLVGRDSQNLGHCSPQSLVEMSDWVTDKQLVARQGTFVRETRELDDNKVISSVFRPLANGGWLELHQDITEQRKSSDRIRYLAQHDELTGLSNRTWFNEILNNEVSRARRDDEVAVLFLDLDKFKAVNDTLGHPIGDQLLKAVAQRLCSAVRETDHVARLGGDEFAIVQVMSDQPEGSSIVAARLVQAFNEPFEVEGHRLTVGCSIGIALAPKDSLDAGDLLRKADLALYRAKADGGSTFRYFEEEMDTAMRDRRELEADLRQAVERNEFELHYQPQVSLPNDALTAFEALLRWNHPVRGMVAPLEFIQLAEELGLISAIGRWVMERACMDANTWPESVSVAVNVSPLQFTCSDVLQDVKAALKHSGLPPHRLQLEITESALLENADQTLEALHALRALGVQIAMDDFGTGYSSLHYLRKFPFDKLKIDKCFVDHLSEEPDNAAIVRAVADLAKGLGMRTTAEGVESSDQRELLEAMGCNEIQGYLISKPKPLTELGDFFPNDSNQTSHEANIAHTFAIVTDDVAPVCASEA